MRRAACACCKQHEFSGQAVIETRPISFRRIDALLTAAVIGVLGGLAEAINGTVRHRLAHLPTGEVVAGELFWYAPLAAAFAMLVVAVTLLIIDMALRGRFGIRYFIPGVCAGLAAYSLLRAMSIGIGNFAAVILAVGIGTLVTRIVMAWPGRIASGARKALPVFVAALALWAIVLPQLRRRDEQKALAQLPAPPAAAPNVLIIIWDTVRAIQTSLHGYARSTTPELVQLAARGAVFERAFSTSPWSLPSHGSLFTGRYPHEMTVGFRAPLDDTHPTLGEVLSARGYTTAGFTANLFYGSRDYGIARGFSWYDERPAMTWRVILHTSWLTRWAFRSVREMRGDYSQILRRHAEDVNASLLAWIARRGERPFFAVVNHFDAHEPYYPPTPFHTSFTVPGSRYWGSDNKEDLTPAVLKELQDAYDGSISYLDHELGRLQLALDSLGVLENTVIVLTADHGEEFGEHGQYQGHAKSLYSTNLHVPLVLAYGKGVPAGVRVQETVSIRDVPATIMDLAGGAAHPFPGVSLARLARRQLEPGDETAPRLQIGEKHRWASSNPEWPASAGDMFSVVRGDLHYIVNADGREELYDFAADAREQENLAADSAFAPALKAFRITLDSLVPAGPGGRQARIRQ